MLTLCNCALNSDLTLLVVFVVVVKSIAFTFMLSANQIFIYIVLNSQGIPGWPCVFYIVILDWMPPLISLFH